MKKLFTLLTFFLLAAITAQAETTTLFHESFGDNSGSARAWDESYSVKTGISSVYSGIESYTITNAKQSKNTVGSTLSGLVQTTSGTDAVLIIGPLNTSNCSNMKLSYQWKAASVKGTYSTKLYYATSNDGTYTEVSGTGAGATTFVERNYTLPEASQVSTLYLKVVWNTSNTQGVIDEVDLSGEINTPSGPVDASWSVSPEAISVASGKTATAAITTNYNGTLSVSSSAEGIATATIEGKTITVNGVGVGNATLTITGAATAAYNAISKTIDVTVTEPLPVVTYTLVTKTEDITDGNYLIVYKDENGNGKVFNGSLETLDALNNNIGVDITDNTISTDEPYYFTINKTDGGYSIKSASGKYIGVTSYANGLSAQETAIENQVAIGTDNEAKISIEFNDGTMSLKFNSASDQNRFRYYKSGQQPIYLYTSGEVTPDKAVTSIAIKTAPTKVEYTEGDKFDPTGLVITATYSDESTEDIAYADHASDFSFSPALTAALATTNEKVTITYGGKSVDQTITVNEKPVPTFASLEELVAADLTSGTIVTVSFEKVPIKDIFVTNNGYRNGVFFDIQKDGKDIEIYFKDVPGYWMVGGNLTGTITCPWTNYKGTWELAPTADWNWECLDYESSGEKIIVAVEVSGTPQKTTYNVGDAFDPTGLVVTATYNDETTAVITEGFTWKFDYGTGNTAFVAGATSVGVVAYVDHLVESEVYTVNGLTVNAQSHKVTIDLTKDETTSANEDKLEWVKEVVTVTAVKGEGGTNANNYYPGTEGKTYTSTRFYSGSTLTFAPANGITITRVVYEATSDGYSSAMANSTWDNAEASASEKTVTITPTDGTKSFYATIGATTGGTSFNIYYVDNDAPTAALESIAVAGQKTSFTEGEEFSFGGTVTATYSDGNTANVTESAVFTGYDKNTIGTQTINVSYTESNVTKTTSYEVTVAAYTPAEGEFKLLTSIDELVAGREYIIVSKYNNEYYGLNTDQADSRSSSKTEVTENKTSANHRRAEKDVVVNEIQHVAIAGPSISVLTLENGSLEEEGEKESTKPKTWKFNSAAGYLTLNKPDSHLTVDVTPVDDNELTTIQFVDDVLQIKFVNHSDYKTASTQEQKTRFVQFYNNKVNDVIYPRFSNYVSENVTSSNYAAVSLYYREASTEPVPAHSLAEIESNGLNGHKYTVTDRLIGVKAVGNTLWAKDDNNSYAKRYKTAETDIDYIQAGWHTDGIYDQSNWIKIVCASAEAAHAGEGKYIEANTVSGVYNGYKDRSHMITLDGDGDLTIDGNAGTYIPNMYCVANFWNDNIYDYVTCGDKRYFFMNPKIEEFCKVTAALWSGNDTFTIYDEDVNGNTNTIKGAFVVDWSLNGENGDYSTLLNSKNSVEAYEFTAIVEKVEKSTTASPAPAKLGAMPGVNPTSQATYYVLYPVDFTATGTQIVTGVNEVNAGKTVKGVRYYNVAGQSFEAAQPGLNIVITEYTDGTHTASKFVR